MSGTIKPIALSRALVVLGADGLAGRGVVEAALASGRAVIAVGLDTTTRVELLSRHPRGSLHALEATIASDADAAELARRLRALDLVIDGVVASLAGTHPCGRLMDEAADVLQRTLDHDLLPHLFAARHLLPLLGEQAAGYVLIGGPGGNYPWAGYGHCSIAAAALRMMARVLHDEAARHHQCVQLLSMDAPLAGEDAPRRALTLGRRALAMLDGAREYPVPIVEFKPDRPSRTAAGVPAPSGSPPARQRRILSDEVLPARDRRAARALLDAIATPTAPGNLHDEHC